MLNSRSRRPDLRVSGVLTLGLVMAAVVACAPANKEDEVASPVAGMTRQGEMPKGESGAQFDRHNDDHTVIAKFVAPVPAVWDAVLGALADKKVTPTLVDRPAGRMGDTALVLMRQWNGQPMSAYVDCGTSMTGPRANDERIHAVLLAQLSRLRADTIAVAVHFSGQSQPIASGNGGATGQCVSSARVEEEILRAVTARLRMAGTM
jgi:hypothetical protein